MSSGCSGPPAKRLRQTRLTFGRGSCSEGLRLTATIGKTNILLIIAFCCSVTSVELEVVLMSHIRKRFSELFSQIKKCDFVEE